MRTAAPHPAGAPSLALLLALAIPNGTAPPPPVPCVPDPLMTIRLVPTAHANYASGTVELRFAASPFGVAVTVDGHHAYEAIVRTEGLGRATEATPVAWAATPELDRVEKLGPVAPGVPLAATVHLNKFLVFITAEESPDAERWSGPILLRGISPSGRMHSMAGHGPFRGEPCGAISPF